MKSNCIGVILLAAGASVRLGRAKQTLVFQNKTLLRHSAEMALKISNRVVVTLGARVETLRAEIEDLPITIAENKDWETGMGGSLKVGLEKLFEVSENLKAVIVLVCDQPFVNSNLLEKLIAEFETTNAPIVACRYGETVGVPALFAREKFPELLALEPSHGAKHLIKRFPEQVAVVRFPEGAFDVDTPDDYEKLIENFT